MARTAVTIGFSVPPEVAREVDRIAREEGVSRSALFREMLRTYSRQRELMVFEDLASYGRTRARQSFGEMSEEEFERAVDGWRHGD